jgi:hypothetical protein
MRRYLLKREQGKKSGKFRRLMEVSLRVVAVVSFKSKGRQGRESSNRKFSSAADKIEEKEGTFHDVLNYRIG